MRFIFNLNKGFIRKINQNEYLISFEQNYTEFIQSRFPKIFVLTYVLCSLFRQIPLYNKIEDYFQRHLHEHANLVHFQQLRNKEQLQNSNISKSNQKKSIKAQSLDYRGMTLKQYFRLSEIGPLHDAGQIKQTQQQNVCSSKEVVTPCFNQFYGRQKIKTETYQDKSLIQDKQSFIHKEKNKQILLFQNRTKQLKVDKLPAQVRPKKDLKNIKNKRQITLGNQHKDNLNRSTITSFYNIEDKQRRMLQKVKNQKQRINQMKLSDAFFITKYAFKFNINSHNAY